MSIRRLLQLLVLAVWLPAVVGMGLLARATYVREVEDARRDLQRWAEGLNSVVERELDKRVVVARTLGASPALDDGDLQSFYGEAQAATAGTGDWVVVVDRERQLVNTRVPFEAFRPLARAAERPFVTAAPDVFFTLSGPVAKQPVVAAFAPQLGGGSPAYNVAVAFHPEVIQQIVTRHPGPDGALVAVVNAEQRIVARGRDIARWLGQRATGPVLQRLERNESGFLSSVTLDGSASTSYVTGANRYRWAVVVALPDALLQASARRLTLQAAAASVLLLALGLGCALLAARRIEKPVLQLNRAAEQLGADTVPPLLSTGVKEADAIGRALHEAGLRAEAATRTLEERVAQAVQQAEQAQQQLLEAQKREAIGRLTGGIAHDFNNLLQTITTGLQVLDREVRSDAPRRALQAVMRSSAKAADLVRQMMTFGRAQSLQPRPVDLRDFLLQTGELTGKALGARISLSAQVEPGLPPAFVDAGQLELALLNLVFNARDAMGEGGGTIRVGARTAAPDEAVQLRPGHYLVLEVADDGPGMPAQVMDKAFEPYFTTKPVGRGSGLGLAQVKFFCRQSGGDALLDSEPGRGTRVRMLLPMSDAGDGDGTAQAALPPPAADRPLRVLMVEDDVLVASVVAPALEQAGHQVTLCGTADEALGRLAAGAQADVLFTDVVMPGSLSGVELVALCRERYPALAVMVASGYSEHRAPTDVQVLRKPYRLEELLQALQQARAVRAEAVRTGAA